MAVVNVGRNLTVGGTTMVGLCRIRKNREGTVDVSVLLCVLAKSWRSGYE